MTRPISTMFAVACTLLACNDADSSGTDSASASGSATTGSSATPTTAMTMPVSPTEGATTSGGTSIVDTTVDPTTGSVSATATATVTMSASDSGTTDSSQATDSSGTADSTDSASASATASASAGGSDSSGTADAASDTAPDMTAGVLTPCEGKIWACGDGIDNDGDGKIDNADFECISPCDDDEGSFQTDLPGMAEDCKNDCFWDLDSGAGQDKCEYNLQCDPKNPGGQIGCGFINKCEAKMPQQCKDSCVPLIPNGCDCFGCCHVITPNGIEDYYLDASDKCSFDNLDACNHCTFQEQCSNPCEGCEVCFGAKTPPKGCDPNEGEQCADGELKCTMGGNDCPETHFCQTGCCQPISPM